MMKRMKDVDYHVYTRNVEYLFTENCRLVQLNNTNYDVSTKNMNSTFLKRKHECNLTVLIMMFVRATVTNSS